MAKRTLLDKLASAFGKRPAEAAEPAPPEAEPAQPPGAIEAEAPGEAGPQALGEIMPPVGPDTPADERLAHSLDAAVAVTERAGQMLEAQAKQQQQTTDAVAELVSMVQAISDKVTAGGEALEAIRTQLGQSADSADRLAEQFNEAAAKLAAAGDNSTRLDEAIAALTHMVDELNGSVAQQGRSERNALAEISRQVQKDISLLRWLVIVAAVLAGASLAATLAVHLLL